MVLLVLECHRSEAWSNTLKDTYPALLLLGLGAAVLAVGAALLQRRYWTNLLLELVTWLMFAAGLALFWASLYANTNSALLRAYIWAQAAVFLTLAAACLATPEHSLPVAMVLAVLPASLAVAVAGFTFSCHPAFALLAEAVAWAVGVLSMVSYKELGSRTAFSWEAESALLDCCCFPVDVVVAGVRQVTTGAD